MFILEFASEYQISQVRWRKVVTRIFFTDLVNFANAMLEFAMRAALMGHFKTDHSCVVNMAKGDVILKPRSDKKENCTHLRQTPPSSSSKVPKLGCGDLNSSIFKIGLIKVNLNSKHWTFNYVILRHHKLFLGPFKIKIWEFCICVDYTYFRSIKVRR